MTDTAFTDLVTLTDDDWFNDVNRLHYTILGDPANAGAIVSTMRATQAQMETASSNALVVTPQVQHLHPGHPKAWGRISGVSTLRAYPATGVSVASTSTGEYTLTHGITFSSSDAYGAQVTAIGTPLIGYVSTYALTQMVVTFIDASGASADPAGFSYIVYGDT